MAFSQQNYHEEHESQKNRHKEDFYKKVPRIGQRHVQVLLLFMVGTIGYVTRISLNVTIVAMTDNSTTTNPDVVTFNWTNSNVIISSFFWGYVGFQVIGAHFMKKHGVKWFILVTMVVNALLFTMIPKIAVWFGSVGVMVCRVLQGILQGTFLPGIQAALGKWAPENERAKLCTIALSGIVFGAILGELTAGYIAASWAGWPATFYIFGGIAFGACILWLVYAQDSPATHPTISRQEKYYIESSLGVEEHAKTSSTPWKAIMTSVPFWALMICNIGVSWVIATLLSETPTYLSKALGFDIQSNGLLSSGPGVVGWLAGLAYSILADYLLQKKYLSTNISRKLFQIYATIPPIICLVCLGFLPKGHKTVSVVLLFLISLFQSGISCGSSLNILDLAPNHSGIIQAVSNTFAAVINIVAPLYVQFAVTDLSSLSQWRQIFLTSASVYLVGGVAFVLFGSAERQWWDSDKNVTEEVVDTETPRTRKSRKISSISGIEMQYI